MAKQYGLGRGRLLRDYGLEQASELKRYEEELGAAEDAAAFDKQNRGWAEILGGATGAALSFLVPGGQTGAYAKEGYLIGKNLGGWGQHGLSKYDPENYALSTDMGKFEVQDKYKMDEINRAFKKADESAFWSEVAETGKDIGSYYLLSEGDDWLSNLFGEESPIDFENVSAGYGNIRGLDPGGGIDWSYDRFKPLDYAFSPSASSRTTYGNLNTGRG